MIIREVPVTEKQLYHIGCLLPIIIGLIVGAVALFQNSEIGCKWNINHADSEREAARYSVYYMADYPDGEYARSAEEIAIAYYNKQYSPQRELFYDFKYSSDQNIKAVVTKLANKLQK